MSEEVSTLRIAVVADLCPGAESKGSRPIDRQRFDEVLAATAPELILEVPDRLADGPDRVLRLRFEQWRDFSPAGLVAGVPELSRARDLLALLGTSDLDPATAGSQAQGITPPGWAERLAAPAAQPDESSSAAAAPSAPADAGGGGVDAILDLVDSDATSESEAGAARRVVDGLTSRPSRGRAPAGIEDARSDLSRRFAEQLDAILQDPAYRALERAWTGLHWLLTRTDFREDIEMRVAAAAIDVAPAAIEALGDEDDFDVVLAAYEHDASARDFERAQSLCRAGESIQSVVVTGLEPGFFGHESWDGLRRGDSARSIFAGQAYAAWRSLRERDTSRWLVPVANRLAIRGRYASGEESTRGVDYEEAVPGGLTDTGVWGVGAVLARSWARTRACVQISGTRNGLIPDLPLLTPAGEKPSPVEGRFGNEQREDLEGIGVTVVQAYQRDVAFVGSVRTFRAPEKFPDAEATADSAQQVTLAYQILASGLVKLLGRVVPNVVGTSRNEATATLRSAVVVHFSRPDAPLGPDHVGIDMRDHEDDPGLTTVVLRVQPEVVVGGRPVNILLEFAVRL